MPLEGELLYYQTIGDGGMEHALNKPFTQPDCGLALMQIGAMMSLLPPRPARILDCGCGTGWLTRMLSRHGYDCVGCDVSPHVVKVAKSNSLASGLNIQFHAAAMEDLPFVEEFDAIVFYDALHHSIDEENAIAAAFRALKPGGVCLTSEPGNGHHASSAEVVAQFNVTEKDMPAKHIIKLARKAGFTRCDTFPRMDAIGRFFFSQRQSVSKWKRLLRKTLLKKFYNLVPFLHAQRSILDDGVVVMHKPARENGNLGGAA